MAKHQRGACVRVKSRYFQNKYFFSVPYSNETLYMKALEYKTYFTHIDSEKILKSLEDIHVFSLDMKYRMFAHNVCQAVSKYMIVLVCVIF
jgi:hypothetical protein